MVHLFSMWSVIPIGYPNSAMYLGCPELQCIRGSTLQLQPGSQSCRCGNSSINIFCFVHWLCLRNKMFELLQFGAAPWTADVVQCVDEEIYLKQIISRSSASWECAPASTAFAFFMRICFELLERLVHFGFALENVPLRYWPPGVGQHVRPMS